VIRPPAALVAAHLRPAAALWLTAALGLAAAGGCEAARTRICEGDPVGSTLTFHGEPVPDDAGCPFAPDAGITFTGTVTFGSGTSALLCIDRNDAQPLRGTHDGDHLVVSSDAGAANVGSGCACDVLVAESVEGDLVRGDGGSAAGFTGELRNALSPADAGASCEPDAGTPGAPPRCGVPCNLRWQLTGS